jgi:zinc protease
LTLRCTHFFALSCLTLLWLAPNDVVAADSTFNAHEYILDNGLHLVVVENHRAPIVTHMVWYRVGSIDEYAGKSGLAHFLEHLMFKGTKTLAAGEFSKTIAQHGGQDNAFTSFDYTAYYQNVASDRLPLVMEMEADRMTGLVIDENEVAAERDVVIEERRMRVDSSPTATFQEQLQALQFEAHPYQVPIIGWPEDLATLTRDDALGFYDAFYGPNNAIVVVVGDVIPGEVKALADKFYGPLPRRQIATRSHAVEPVHTMPQELIVRDARINQPTWSLSYLAPSYGVGDASHIYALQVLAEIIGGGNVSRLYEKLVIEDEIAIDIGVHYSPVRLGPAKFSIGAVPQGDEVEVLAPAIAEVVAEVLKNGVRPGELDRAKRSLTAQVIYARDSGHGLANVFGSTLVNGRSIAELEAWPGNINAVTNEDVMRAAKHVFIEANSITGILLPDTPMPEPGSGPNPEDTTPVDTGAASTENSE